jgi:hypothetical protein
MIVERRIALSIKGGYYTELGKQFVCVLYCFFSLSFVVCDYCSSILFWLLYLFASH